MIKGCFEICGDWFELKMDLGGFMSFLCIWTTIYNFFEIKNVINNVEAKIRYEGFFFIKLNRCNVVAKKTA